MTDYPILTAVKSQVKDVTLPINMSVHATSEPAARSAIESAFTECIKATRKEHGCIACDLNRSYVEPNKYINFERWPSVAALEAHLNAPTYGETSSHNRPVSWCFPHHQILCFRR